MEHCKAAQGTTAIAVGAVGYFEAWNFFGGYGKVSNKRQVCLCLPFHSYHTQSYHSQIHLGFFFILKKQNFPPNLSSTKKQNVVYDDDLNLKYDCLQTW